MMQITTHQFIHVRKQWRNLGLLPLLLFMLNTSNLLSQIEINEVDGNGTVELINNGTSAVDISSYWLCNIPAYTQISNLTVDCGNLNLAAGEIITITGFNSLNENDAELGLYSTNNFGSSTAIVDYLEWGSTGHGRSSVAVNAGVWTTGEFVASFGSNESIAVSGTGNTAADWTAQT